MKKLATLVIAVALLLALAPGATAPALAARCVTIQDGVIKYSPGHYLAGQPLKVGYDVFGYNYQAHLFNGSYANVYLGGDGLPPYEGDPAAYLAKNPSAAGKWSVRLSFPSRSRAPLKAASNSVTIEKNPDRTTPFQKYIAGCE